MTRFARDNGLSLFFLGLFVATVAAESVAGQHSENADLAEHGAETISWWTYVISPSFAGALMENWQSEFLQFSLFIGATIWLVQKGSNESSMLEQAGPEDDRTQLIGRFTPIGGPGVARRNDARTRIYENSLLLVMTLIFFATWFAQSLNNWRVFNDERQSHDLDPIALGNYLVNADFWEKTLQNWQSEFLAVGTMVVFTIYLRQRGSPESKPVGAPHDETGSSG
jgi:dipeptide/tripeptide permease